MASREDVLAYVRDQYGVEADYPWSRNPNYAVLRHAHNRKWFGAIVNITADKLGLPSTELVDALNLKCDPDMVIALRDKVSVFPAYHMNKEHWISVLLDDALQDEQLYALINLSHELSKQV